MFYLFALWHTFSIIRLAYANFTLLSSKTTYYKAILRIGMDCGSIRWAEEGKGDFLVKHF